MQNLLTILEKHQKEFNKVVDFNPQNDKLCVLDFTARNTMLSDADIADTGRFTSYINSCLQSEKARYGIGGYAEIRTVYRRSELFEGAEPRTLHLGIDIWGPAGTQVYVPLGGTVHSFAVNNNFGDYGATVVLQHQLDTKIFHTLYGHLSSNDLIYLKEGKYISRGEVIGHFGGPGENGNWPPHLHFQVIEDMRLKKGDYPGVCAISEREFYLANCPDPDLILQLKQYLR